MPAALMARRPVSKELWRQLQPLIPAFVPSAKGGARKLAVSDEAALNGILFVLQTGIPWEDLPQSLGYGSGMTCWRRLRDWNAAGVWEQLHQAMLTRLREHDQIDWSRASIDGSSAYLGFEKATFVAAKCLFTRGHGSYRIYHQQHAGRLKICPPSSEVWLG